MTIKYLGILAISCAISVFGAIKASEIKHKSEARKEILHFLMHVETGIKYGSSSLAEIYDSFKSDLLDKCGFTNIIRQGPPYTFSVEGSFSELSKEENSYLSEFFTKIGKSYSREEEIKLCRYYISVFELFYEESKKNDKSKAVLYRKLGIICALLAAIILI